MSETARSRVAPIGKMLFDAGLCSREQVERALEMQRAEGGKTFEILIRLGYLDKSALHALLSRQQGIASIDLARFRVSPDLLSLIPKELALKELVLPIDKLGRLLTVAMACPIDMETIGQIEQLTGLSVKAMLAKYDDIAAAVEKYYPKHDSHHDALPVFEMPRQRSSAESSNNLTDQVKQLVLPASAPGVAARVLEMARTSNPDMKALLQAAAADPVLCGWLLAVANSPAYGMPAQVESLGLAFALLGASGLATAVEHFQKDAPSPKFDTAALLATSQKASLAAAALAKKSGKIDRGAAFTCGLLRKLGVFALAAVSQEAGALPAELTEAERCAQERQRFGITHLEAGAIIASRWRLPQQLCEAIGTPAADTNTPSPCMAVAIIAAETAAGGEPALQGLGNCLDALKLDAPTAFAEVRKLIQ